MKSAQEDQYLEFVAARAKALYRSAYVLAAGDTHLAEDLVQETLSRVYVHWKRVARADSPAAYAQTVLVRTSLTLRRRRSTGERPIGKMPDSAAAGPETAQMLKLSSSAVRSQGTRALNRVRALLGDSLSDLVPH
ncbi:sigma factor [Streptomyces sp. NPDC059970]|uniref:sigma factor n=1 Tax=Streptomyces sp. NPDC059970 TaxID=3347019 RepID=UPI0036A5D076